MGYPVRYLGMETLRVFKTLRVFNTEQIRQLQIGPYFNHQMKMIWHQAEGIGTSYWINIMGISFQKEPVVFIFVKDVVFGVSMIINMVYSIRLEWWSLVSHDGDDDQ